MFHGKAAKYFIPCLTVVLLTSISASAQSSPSCSAEQKAVDKQQKRYDRTLTKHERLVDRNNTKRLSINDLVQKWSTEATRQRQLYQTGCLTQGLFGGNFSKCQQRALAASNRANAKRNAARAKLDSFIAVATTREASSQSKVDSENAKLTDLQNQLQQCLHPTPTPTPTP